MPGQIVPFEIPADDTVASREFRGSLLRWTFEVFPGPSEYHMSQITPGQTGGAIINTEPGKQGTRAYFNVDDINAGAARVKELGGEANEPVPVPGMGWFSICRDSARQRVRPLAARHLRAHTDAMNPPPVFARIDRA